MRAVVVLIVACVGGALLAVESGRHQETVETWDNSEVPRVVSLLSDLNRDMLNDAKSRREIRGADYAEPLSVAVRARIVTIDSPTVLRDLYVACQDERDKGRLNPRPQPYLTLPDAFFDAQSCVLDRLAQLRTDEAARTLTWLVADKRFSFDGERGHGIRCAVKGCGPACLKHLRAIRGDRELLAQGLVRMIENNEPAT